MDLLEFIHICLNPHIVYIKITLLKISYIILPQKMGSRASKLVSNFVLHTSIVILQDIFLVIRI